jgi:NAD-dependent deacetylase
MEIATHHHFKRHPEQVWSWYLSRFTSLGDVRPNPAHEALVTLEQLCEDQTQRFTLVTQNVDTLHSAAGSRDVIEVHGSSAQLRCSNEGECALAAPQGLIDWDSSLFERFLQTQEAKDLPCCPRCDELLRPHVLWFDESYHDHEAYRFSHVVGHMKSVDLVLFVGTSFSVGITELIQRFALQRGASLWAIDPHPVLDECADEMRWVVAPSEEALPQLVEIYRAL